MEHYWFEDQEIVDRSCSLNNKQLASWQWEEVPDESLPEQEDDYDWRNYIDD